MKKNVTGAMMKAHHSMSIKIFLTTHSNERLEKKDDR